jgi:hypothetical protein
MKYHDKDENVSSYQFKNDLKIYLKENMSDKLGKYAKCLICMHLSTSEKATWCPFPGTNTQIQHHNSLLTTIS